MSTNFAPATPPYKAAFAAGIRLADALGLGRGAGAANGEKPDDDVGP